MITSEAFLPMDAVSLQVGIRSAMVKEQLKEAVRGLEYICKDKAHDLSVFNISWTGLHILQLDQLQEGYT